MNNKDIIDLPIININCKIYDVAIINNDINLLNELRCKNMIVNIEENKLDILYKYKILIILNDHLSNEILYENAHYYKFIILRKNNTVNNIINDYIINISYILIPFFVKNIILNYNDIYNKLFENLDSKYLYENNKIHGKYNFGFIITRYVNSEKTNLYWINCYKNIRKFYKNRIIIIDDNSDKEYIQYDFELENCNIISSEYPKAGEILGYYYYYKYHFFEKAIILHDSTFINKYIDFSKHDKIKFIWHFKHDWDNIEEEIHLLKKLNNEELNNFYYEKDNWVGCYGLQSVIEYSFLKEITKKYNFFHLLKFIHNRNSRMNMERIFAVVLTYHYKDLILNPSIYGIIHHYIHWGYLYDNYLVDNNDHLDIIKVWTGR